MTGCFGPTLSDESTRATDAWRGESARFGPAGDAGSFDLEGKIVVLDAEDGRGEVGGPFRIEPASPEVGAENATLHFREADVAGYGRGFLTIEGSAQATRGRVEDLRVARLTIANDVHVALAPSTRGGVELPPHPAEWSQVEALRGRVDAFEANFTNVVLEGYSRAVLLRSSGSVVNLSGPLHLERADGMIAAKGTRFLAEFVNATFGRATIDAAAGTGSAVLEAHGRVESPRLIHARSFAVIATEGRLASVGLARITQVDTGTGFLLDADLELVTAPNHVVSVGGSKWARVAFREKSALGDAVIHLAQVSGEGADMVTVPRNPDPGTDTGFFRRFECAFRECVEEHVLPTWVGAGEMGAFYVKINGTLPARDYDVVLRIVGANFPTALVDFTVTVTD